MPEGESAEGGGGGAEETQVWLDAHDVCDTRLRILLPQGHKGGETGPPMLVLHATSQLLVKIPFFSTCMSEPWQAQTVTTIPEDGSIRRDLVLVCPPQTAPPDVCQCLRLLKAERQGLVWTVDSVLRVLRAASYLGYEEGVDLCMKFLAVAVWSSAERVAVHATFESTGIKPSADVRAKLEPMEDAHEVVKAMLLAHVSSGYECLIEFVREGCSTSAKVARMCVSALTQVWALCMEDAIKANTYSRYGEWCTCTRVILLYGDVDAIVRIFVQRCKAFGDAIRVSAYMWPPATGILENVVTCVAALLERLVVMVSDVESVSPLKNGWLTLLPNSDRCKLVPVFFGMAHVFHGNQRIHSAVENIMLSLPLQVEGYAEIKNRQGPLYHYSTMVREVFFRFGFLCKRG